MSDKDSNLLRDVLGIVLFAAAATLGVSSVMGWLNSASPAEFSASRSSTRP
jgi:hypothetical protein